MDLDAIIDELYALPPEHFTAARNAEVKQARASGDRGLADRLGGLRRPTVSAWLVNQLSRQTSGAMKELLMLGPALRAAQAARDGAEMRRLAAERHRLMSTLLRSARQVASEGGHQLTGPVEQELTATMEAALADPAVGGAVRSGRLMAPVRYSGFGEGLSPNPAEPDAAARPSSGSGAGPQRRHVVDGKAPQAARRAAKELAREL